MSQAKDLHDVEWPLPAPYPQNANTIAKLVNDAYYHSQAQSFEEACRLCTLNKGEPYYHKTTGTLVFIFSDNSYASPLRSGIFTIGAFGEEDWLSSGRFEKSAEDASPHR